MLQEREPMKGNIYLPRADLSNHAPGVTSTTCLDFSWTTFVGHKMATAQGAKSTLVSYGGRTKAVKQVHNHNAEHKNPQKHVS